MRVDSLGGGFKSPKNIIKDGAFWHLEGVRFWDFERSNT